MKNLIFASFLCFSLAIIWACEKDPLMSHTEMRDLTATEQSLVEMDNRFGLKLFKQITATEPADQNVFISPLSVSMALGMTYNGANGTTRDAMAQTLELQDLTIEEANAAYRSLIKELVNLDPGVRFNLANSIWHRDDWTFEQPFLNTCQEYFDAEVRGLDFNDPGSVDVINGWIEDATNGKIEDVIQAIDPLSVMFLINAIYFKGTWLYEFNPDDTRDETFYGVDGAELPCRMMAMEGDLPYRETDLYQAVDLPYGDGPFRMTIFLPKSDHTVDELIAALDAQNWYGWLNFEERGIALFMPKFKIEYKLKMKPILSALGMEVAFDPYQANFTNMHKSGSLYINEVTHQTFVEVNEEGTEAAAVTVVDMWTQSAGGGSALPMQVDRPFFFVIRENKSNTLLFMGKIVDPVYED